MKMVRVIVLNGLSVFIRVITLLGINKAVAYFAGPSSFAIISQLQNLIAMALVFPSSAINGATVKLIAARKDNETEIEKVSQTSFSVMFYFSLIFCILILIFGGFISFFLLKTYSYSYVIRLFAVCIFFFALNSFLLALFNGRGEIKKYIACNIIGNIITLVFSVVLIINFKIDGALISIATNQVLNVIVTICVLKKTNWFKLSEYISITSFIYLKEIMHFAAMPIFAALIMPVSLTIVRNFIVSSSSWNDAGVWDALWKISNVYLMIITLTLNVYLLPKLSSLFHQDLIVKELLKSACAVVAIMISIAVMLFLYKDLIIKLLFTKEFIKVSDYILFQVLGDFFKMLSWIIAYYMLSKSRVMKYIFSESVQWVGFVILCWALPHGDIITGVMHAYVISQIIYFITLLLLLIHDMKIKNVKCKTFS
ncbi:O-antigen translocase [Buttiauxella sp. S04-F03]|uniref:O-antigen translocase n=1 Tax=Buttiauxella sp. S04-F03 TaxID=2904525 RepID=UPI001E287C3E|nr:O-antigen translocase [Buttiauxella sp. S04-F03]MCE0812473.1 O-antigen translocase [Buttiauxella sp. S04-F03]